MIYKVVIKDNKNTPIHYLPDLDSFQNGREYVFKPGVNIIVGDWKSQKIIFMEIMQRLLRILNILMIQIRRNNYDKEH